LAPNSTHGSKFVLDVATDGWNRLTKHFKFVTGKSDVKGNDNKEMTRHKITKTSPDSTTIVIRLMVGLVFVSEGIQKFLFPENRGVGRFENIGLPNPEFLAPFVATFEITCGTLILLGLFTRLHPYR
jgi:hypothetical protein